MPSALGGIIEAEDIMVGQRHVTRRRHVAATDELRIGDGLVGGRDTGGS